MSPRSTKDISDLLASLLRGRADRGGRVSEAARGVFGAALSYSGAGANACADVSDVEMSTHVAPDGTEYDFAVTEEGACIVACRPAPDATVLDVPALMGGRRVVAIGAFALSSFNDIASIFLPDGAVYIGHLALSACPDLREVAFAREGTSFDRSWLQGSSRVERVVLPGSIEFVRSGGVDLPSLRTLVVGCGTRRIDPLAFSKLSLERIAVVPENPYLSSDGRAVFADGGTRLVATAVRSEFYIVPAGVEVIGQKAFAYHSDLTRVELPDGLREIAPHAFFESGIESCDLPATVRRIGEKAFCQCKALASVELPDGLEVLGDEAFARTSIDRLSLPAGLCELGRDAWAGSAVRAIGETATLSIDPGNKRFFLDGAGGIYARESDGNVLFALVGDRLDYSALPGTVAVAPQAARRNRALKTLQLPEGVHAIGDAAFAQCTNLVRVSLPNTLEVIGNEAFFGTSLEAIRIPSSVRHVGDLALGTHGSAGMAGEPTLRAVSVDSANDAVFIENGILCERLIDAPDGSRQLRVILWVGEGGTLDVPDDVVEVAPFAFAGIGGIDRLVLHEGIRLVGTRAFAFSHAPFTVRVRLAHPIGDETSVTVHVPDHYSALASLVQALSAAEVSAKIVAQACDMAMLRYGSIYERGRCAVERLSNPVLLALGVRQLYDEVLRRRLIDVCAAFAKHGYLEGLDYLADFGYVDADNITSIVDTLSTGDYVSAVGHLLELKRCRFDWTRFDLDL